MKRSIQALFFIFFFILFRILFPQEIFKIDSSFFGDIKPRMIGPAVMSGRITDIEGVSKNPKIIYVGTAGGGIWKSINGGVSFSQIFEKYTMSIGCITVNQNNPHEIWVGTGEINVRNSVSVGTGLYRSKDEGKSWEHLGFKDSERIAEIALHPKDPKIAYICVLGSLWSPSKERGVYKTKDGGKNWEKILYVDENTGCGDLAIDPQEPDVIYAGMWQVRRMPYFFTSGGPGSGFFKSTDGGKTWKKIKKGLPEGDLGRIVFDVASSRPGTIYGIFEAKKETALYRSDDMGESWKRIISFLGTKARPFYLSEIKVDPGDHRRLYNLSVLFFMSDDGGKSFNPVGAIHPDMQAIWINPSNPDHILVGTDGGVYLSFDRGGTFKLFGNIPVSQFYHVSYDMKIPYNVYGGLQDNGSWMGPSKVVGGRGVENRHWRNIGRGDGFHAFPDPTDPDIVYSEWQGGRLVRLNLRTMEMKEIQPYPKKGEPKYRFNWNTPVLISPNNPEVMYIGSQFLFRTKDKGETWERISPDLTTNDPNKQRQAESGGLTIDYTSAENHCTIYTISESPMNPDIIWVGTDDGNLQLTTDGGKTWKNLVKNVPALPPNTWCSHVEASRHKMGRAYATFDGHQTGDMKPYVYKTEDFGKTWESLVTSDISGYCHVIREDLVNPDLLFLGTEFGLFISIDRGKNWAHLKENFPMVAVRDMVIHPREHDLIIATHGLGIWIMDDLTPLRNLKRDILKDEVAILPSRPSTISYSSFIQDFPGDDGFIGANPPSSATITYYLKERHIFGDLKLEIIDSEGKIVKSLPTGKRKGINKVYWDMRLKPPKISFKPGLPTGIAYGPMIPEGTYTIRITKNGKSYYGKLELLPDPVSAHNEEDRKFQYDTVMKLYEMLEKLAYISDSVLNVKKELDGRIEFLEKEKREKNLRIILKEFSKKLKKFHSELVSEEGMYTEPKLSEKVLDLYSSVSSYGGRPTNSQLLRMSVLEEEVKKAEAKFKEIKEKEISQINSKLATAKLKPIKIMEEDEFRKKEMR